MLDKLYKHKFYAGMVLLILGTIDLYVIGIAMVFIPVLRYYKYINYIAIVPILIGAAMMEKGEDEEC